MFDSTLNLRIAVAIVVSFHLYFCGMKLLGQELITDYCHVLDMLHQLTARYNLESKPLLYFIHTIRHFSVSCK